MNERFESNLKSRDNKGEILNSNFSTKHPRRSFLIQKGKLDPLLNKKLPSVLKNPSNEDSDKAYIKSLEIDVLKYINLINKTNVEELKNSFLRMKNALISLSYKNYIGHISEEDFKVIIETIFNQNNFRDVYRAIIYADRMDSYSYSYDEKQKKMIISLNRIFYSSNVIRSAITSLPFNDCIRINKELLRQRDEEISEIKLNENVSISIDDLKK